MKVVNHNQLMKTASVWGLLFPFPWIQWHKYGSKHAVSADMATVEATMSGTTDTQPLLGQNFSSEINNYLVWLYWKEYHANRNVNPLKMIKNLVARTRLAIKSTCAFQQSHVQVLLNYVFQLAVQNWCSQNRTGCTARSGLAADSLVGIYPYN